MGQDALSATTGSVPSSLPPEMAKLKKNTDAAISTGKKAADDLYGKAQEFTIGFGRASEKSLRQIGYVDATLDDIADSKINILEYITNEQRESIISGKTLEVFIPRYGKVALKQGMVPYGPYVNTYAIAFKVNGKELFFARDTGEMLRVPAEVSRVEDVVLGQYFKPEVLENVKKRKSGVISNLAVDNINIAWDDKGRLKFVIIAPIELRDGKFHTEIYESETNEHKSVGDKKGFPGETTVFRYYSVTFKEDGSFDSKKLIKTVYEERNDNGGFTKREVNN